MSVCIMKSLWFLFASCLSAGLINIVSYTLMHDFYELYSTVEHDLNKLTIAMNVIV